MKHLISSRTALCLCGLTLCFNASAQGYVSYNHDAAKMNQITVQEIGAGGLTPAFYYESLHISRWMLLTVSKHLLLNEQK